MVRDTHTQTHIETHAQTHRETHTHKHTHAHSRTHTTGFLPPVRACIATRAPLEVSSNPYVCVCVCVCAESAQSTCKLAIPCVGAFLLTACTNDTAPTTCTTLTLGLNATQWDNTPWASWDIPTLSHKIIPNSNGSLTAQLSFSNPWGAGVSALVTWGSTGQALQRQYFENIAQGSVTLSVSVGQECDGGCRAAVLVSVPERTAVDPVPGARRSVRACVRACARANMCASLREPDYPMHMLVHPHVCVCGSTCVRVCVCVCVVRAHRSGHLQAVQPIRPSLTQPRGSHTKHHTGERLHTYTHTHTLGSVALSVTNS